jgi:L-lactate utilization protein LutC
LEEETPLPGIDDKKVYRNDEFAHHQPLKFFAEKLAGLKGEFYPAKDTPAAAKILRTLLSEHATNQKDQSHPVTVQAQAARHRHPLLDQIFAADKWLADNVQLIDGHSLSSPDFAHIAVGITAVDFLIARAGSIVLSAATAGGRRFSVLPAFHIAVAMADQLVISLDDALQIYTQRAECNRSSYATIITGPSRTSDIEKILVLGAHGPKRLAVIAVEENV